MRLLILTQKIDKTDPVLGFFHGWVEALAPQFEKVSVICLEKGEFALPQNVKVYSLGKESGRSKIKYVKNFFNLILGLNREYDRVFVHMNQEYVWLGGWLWRVMCKPIYFWRNHPKGDLLTRVAVGFSRQVFYTSPSAFVARFKKAILMPIGINTQIFKPQVGSALPNSLLCLGRISPIKNIHLMLEVARILANQNIKFTLEVVGEPVNPEDFDYYARLVEDNDDLVKRQILSFQKAVSNQATPSVYGRHVALINLTPVGSGDKTILEAAACGATPFFASRIGEREIKPEVAKLIMVDLDPQKIAEKIKNWLEADPEIKRQVVAELQKFVLENHSLSALIEMLCIAIKK